MLTYEQTIKILGDQSFGLYMGGHMSYHPEGTWIVGKIYDVPSSKVEEDIDAYRLARIEEQVAKHKRPAYYDAEGGSMSNGIGRDYF